MKNFNKRIKQYADLEKSDITQFFIMVIGLSKKKNYSSREVTNKSYLKDLFNKRFQCNFIVKFKQIGQADIYDRGEVLGGKINRQTIPGPTPNYQLSIFQPTN